MHYACMGINITIRNIPNDVRDELAVRAARQSQSMQEYLRNELIELAARPDKEQWLSQVAEQRATYSNRVQASAILKERDKDRR